MKPKLKRLELALYCFNLFIYFTYFNNVHRAPRRFTCCAQSTLTPLSTSAFKFNLHRYIKVKKNEIVKVEMEINAFKKKGEFTFVGTGTGSVVKVRRCRLTLSNPR